MLMHLIDDVNVSQRWCPLLITAYTDREPTLDSRSAWIAEEGLDSSRNEARASERGMAARSPSLMTTYTDREPPLD